MARKRCKYCDDGEALVIGETDDQGIAIQYPNFLTAYGYDVHGSNANGLRVAINYCPVCGRKLVKDKPVEDRLPRVVRMYCC